MILAEYDRKNLKLTVNGHAGCGEPGHDIVCAAASILVYTLASNVAQMSADRKRIRRPVIKIEDGDSVVSCDPVHGMAAITTLLFDSICEGFDILAQKYPENVRYIVIG